jgi:hypothetical protein
MVRYHSLISMIDADSTLTIAADSSRDMASSPLGGMGQMPTGPQDYTKLFASEKDNLQLAEGLYSWVGEDVERRVLQKYGKLPK